MAVRRDQEAHFDHYDHSCAAGSNSIQTPYPSTMMMWTTSAEAFFGAMKRICDHLQHQSKQTETELKRMPFTNRPSVQSIEYSPDECIDDCCLTWWWLEDLWWLDDRCCDPELCVSLCELIILNGQRKKKWECSSAPNGWRRMYLLNKYSQILHSLLNPLSLNSIYSLALPGFVHKWL